MNTSAGIGTLPTKHDMRGWAVAHVIMVGITLAFLALCLWVSPVNAARPTTESSMNSTEGTVSCLTTITRVPCPASGVRAIHVRVTGATDVGFGGSAVTFATSPIIRSTSGEYSANRGQMWCIATGSTSTVTYSCLN